MNKNTENEDSIQDDEESIECECWCGAKGTYSELHDDQYLDTRCGGTGVLYCYCGGDLCVCHNHSEVDCLGCVDCQDDEDDLYCDNEDLLN
ncbi:MAG: hypothetical protein ACR65O_05420 [Methylomicrobium sp.]